MTPHKNSLLIFDKGAKANQWEKDSHFNNCCWDNSASTCKKVNLDTHLTSATKIYLKWITDPNIKFKNVKLE